MDQVPQDFAVGRRPEEGSPPFQFDFQLFGIDYVAVMDDGEVMRVPVEYERLDIVQFSTTRGAVSDMADGEAAGVLPERIPREDMGDQSQPFPDGNPSGVLQRGHAATFLPPVLQGAEADEDVRGRLVDPEHPEYPAFLAERPSFHHL